MFATRGLDRRGDRMSRRERRWMHEIDESSRPNRGSPDETGRSGLRGTR
jgi:hypothetical protein